MSNTGDLIETAMMKLVHHERFFANLLLNMTRTYTTEIPTVGVNVTDTVNLYVNPHFWSSLSIDEQVDVLKHECYHVLNNHFARFKDLEPEMFAPEKQTVVKRVEGMLNASSLNKAADAAINEYLPHLPKKWKMFDKDGKVMHYPETFQDQKGQVQPHPEAGKPIIASPILVDLLKKQFPKIEKLKHMEYYYDFFKSTQPKVKMMQKPSNCPDCKQKQDEAKQKQQQAQQGQQPGQQPGDQGQESQDGQGQPQDGNGNQPGNGDGGTGHGNSDQFCDKHQGGKGQGQGGGSGNGPGEILVDDHSMWQQGNQDAEYVTEKVKQTVNKAVEASGGREAGTIPTDVVQMIEALNYKPRDWKNDLQRFVSRTSEIIMESSRKVRNRRYGILYPGVKVYPKLTLAAAVDTSGSMSDEALNQIAAELAHIAKNNVEIWVIEADCVVQNVWKFDVKKLKEFKGRGGTAYQPALDKAAELDVDGLIYFGDMDSADRPKKPKYPVMWAVVNSGQKPPATWGMVTEVKITKKPGK